jgi:hypothetical protein
MGMKNNFSDCAKVGLTAIGKIVLRGDSGAVEISAMLRLSACAGRLCDQLELSGTNWSYPSPSPPSGKLPKIILLNIMQ